MQFEFVHSERRRNAWWFDAQQGRRQLYLASAITVLLGLLIGFIAGQLIGDVDLVSVPPSDEVVAAHINQ